MDSDDGLSHVARGQTPLPRQLMPKVKTVSARRVAMEARRKGERIVKKAGGLTVARSAMERNRRRAWGTD